MPGHFLVNILEHGAGIMVGPATMNAELLGFLVVYIDLLFELSRERYMAGFVPFAVMNEMGLQPQDGIAQRPVLIFIAGA